MNAWINIFSCRTEICLDSRAQWYCMHGPWGIRSFCKLVALVWLVFSRFVHLYVMFTLKDIFCKIFLSQKGRMQCNNAHCSSPCLSMHVPINAVSNINLGVTHRLGFVVLIKGKTLWLHIFCIIILFKYERYLRCFPRITRRLKKGCWNDLIFGM